jgi:hypothetical protein
MATATTTVLKTYFNTGDKPTQQNFYDVLESNLNLTDGGTVAGASKFTHVNGLVASRTLQSVANVAPTDISATALSVNTYYKSIAAATAMTIPSAAAGAIGDFISIFYSVAITAGAAHTFTTTTDTAFTLGSTAVRIGGGIASSADLSVALDNVLTITGHATGDGGLGTTVRFVNVTGAAQGWAVEAITTNQGAGSTAGTIAFSAV